MSSAYSDRAPSDTKLVSLVGVLAARGEGAGRSPACAGSVAVQGCGFEGDLVAEGFELVDQVPLAGLGVDAPLEVVGAELVIGAGAGQDVPDDHDHCVSYREDGLGFTLGAEPAVEPTELGGQVVGLAMRCRPGCFTHRRAQRRVALAGLPGAAFAGRLVMSGAEPNPGRQVLVGREPGHVDADLGDDDLSDAFADTRDRQQTGGGLIERGHQPVDLAVEAGFHGDELVDVVQVHPQQQGVVLIETADEGFA
jgi:hypothetical protein